MNPTPADLLDHALGLLDRDAPAMRAVDHALAHDPATAANYDRLLRNLGTLRDDDPADPPPGLAARTIDRVAAHRELARKRPRRRVFSLMPSAVPFRWTDMAVAAGIFVAGVLTLLPATHRTRMNQSQVACLANLQQLGTALNRYAQSHDGYPYPDPKSENSLCGCFAAILHDEGLLASAGPLHCPSSADHAAAHPPALPHMNELDDRAARTPAAVQKALKNDYAYHRGVQTEEGTPRALDPSRLVGAVLPLLADQPPHDDRGRIFRGNSPNHGGWGQNVLFVDGHAAWRRNRWVSGKDADLFLNQNRQPAPGVHLYDSSLGPSIFPVSLPR